jgi:tRNA(His) 5'-end guanylyltransferase
MNDPLGDRIKKQYEDRTRYYLPRRTYTILRLDGKAFHTYTKKLKNPFDAALYGDIDEAIIAMLPEIQGAVFAYTQSDEISVLLTDFATPQTSAWFDGNIQKMTSVSASIMTAEFNKWRIWRQGTNNGTYNFSEIQLAYFDSRVFTIPDRTEVMNYFRWRQQDCIRNSVSMVAQANFSHRELHGKTQSDIHEMLHQKGVNWAIDFSDGEKNGRIIVKESYTLPSDSTNGTTERTGWFSRGAWEFTKDNGKLLKLIPEYS